ncbi:MAG: hypothetical protein GXO74_02300 [Calditrichaeota bacterium]|nr:hypothetical protein [Calditrichota bacterium]
MSGRDDALREENRKMQFLRLIVDATAARLRQGDLSTMEALALISETKKAVLRLFPDKEETYDLIYKSRFERILKETMESN